MNPLVAENTQSGKDGGSFKHITRSVTRHSSFISPPSIVAIHIADDEEQNTSVERFPTSRWESKATFCALEKLRRDYRIPDSIELNISSPNEYMATRPEGCVALYPSIFKAGIRLALHPSFTCILDLLKSPLPNLTQWFSRLFRVIMCFGNA